MSATDPLANGGGAADQKAYEPSMEEILASIRRIISDDQSFTAQTAVRSGEANLRAALEASTVRQAPPPAAPTTVPERDAPVLRGTVDAAPPSLTKESIGGNAVRPVAPSVQAATVAAPETVAFNPEPVAPQQPVAPRVVSAAVSLGQISAPQFPTPTAPAEVPVTRMASPAAEGDAVEVFRFTPSSAATPDRGGETTTTPDADAASWTVSARREKREEPSVPPQAPQKDATPVSNLFSTTTDQTVTAAFNTLTATRLVENDDALKAMASEMMRPLLKAWLDENLPALVERLVRAEIERVARGGR